MNKQKLDLAIQEIEDLLEHASPHTFRPNNKEGWDFADGWETQEVCFCEPLPLFQSIVCKHCGKEMQS